jgi:hypothetical protein
LTINFPSYIPFGILKNKQEPDMSHKKGIITLMGSGELTATIFEVHKKFLSGLPDPP